MQAKIFNLVRIGLSMCPKARYTDLVYKGGTRPCGPILRIFNTDRPMANRSLFAKFEVHGSDAIVITTGGRTDRKT